ncbi:MAG: polysaccharide deacetylase family protein [Steroidobacteraceae bacterium]|jgi:peptidoglycan/xylan/chitin deacetylase (PgdA/CDA1 family)|nr:polysaccharide deacetylase family protein [Steroidobacteraceae bacterium]
MSGGIAAALGAAWRKNAPDVAGLWNGALPAFVTARRPAERLAGVPVFCYHVVTAAEFGADLEFLRRNGYATLSSHAFLDVLAARAVVPERAVLLTFDDGPRNFHDVAFPLLLEFGARATCFVAPGLHADEFHDVEARPMTWTEIRRIACSGLVDFQSHTLESRYVPEWPNPAGLSGCAPELEARRRGVPLPLVDDLLASRREIERRLPGARVDQLAFPMYVGTPNAVAVARALGFRACYWGLTPGRALNRPGDDAGHVVRLSDEYLRRLPGEGRRSVPGLFAQRLRRARAGRDWRRRHA